MRDLLFTLFSSSTKGKASYTSGDTQKPDLSCKTKHITTPDDKKHESTDKKPSMEGVDSAKEKLSSFCNMGSAPGFYKIFTDEQARGAITESNFPNSDLLSLILRCKADSTDKVIILQSMQNHRPNLLDGIEKDEKGLAILENGQPISPSR